MIDRRLAWSAGLLLLAASLLTGCGKDSTKPNGDSGPKTPITYPLGVGDRWAYAIQVVTEGVQDTLSRADEIIGVESRAGEDYYRLEGTPSDGSPSSSTYLRQAGQSLYIYPDITFDSSPEGAWVSRQVQGSLPWKLADFTGQIGTVFRFESDTTFEGTYQLVLSIVTANAGRTDVTVPEGRYTDVYVGRMTVLAVFRYGGIDGQQISSTTELYIKDGVGLLKEVEEDRVPSQLGEIVTTRTSVLRAKHLVR